MENQNAEKAPFVGQAVVFGNMANPDTTGWIADIQEQQNKVYTLGAGKMEREHFQIFVAWENLTTSEVSEGIARPWIDKAEAIGIEAKTADEVKALWTEAQTAEQAAREQRQKEFDQHQQRVSDWRDSIRDKIPADAKAVLIAECVQDQSDSMTDYFGSSTTKIVILGFSRHQRDLFPEMRKAAARFEGTAHLTDAPDDAEHREKYSMGGGYYLKAGYRHSDGWKVRKQAFYGERNDRAEYLPFGEWAVPEGEPFVTGNAQPRTEAGAAATDDETCGGFSISEHTHTKRGFQMWIVSPAQRVERETYNAWLAKAKELKGWYSRKFGTTPAGFAFKDAEIAKQFAEDLAA
ncbi:MAG: hypothetical protein AAGA97_01165 [Pseudomonadota bacterium]